MKTSLNVIETWTRLVTGDGDFFMGTVGANDMTMDATVIGMAGMAGNDTLRAGDSGSFLFGDFFSTDWFANLEPYDYSVIGDDLLLGGASEDIMFGGPGRDTMVGGGGGDVYALFGPGNDVIREKAGGGKDTIWTDHTSYVLGDFLENLSFSGITSSFSKNVQGTGNALSNFIESDRGDDTLRGMDGNDTLSGGLGRDLLVGGAGNDCFAFGFNPARKILFSSGAEADKIQDFAAADDQIFLFSMAFGAVFATPGVIKQGQFGLVGTTLTGNEKILYDQSTGDLMTADRTVFAHLGAGTVLTYQDIEWASF